MKKEAIGHAGATRPEKRRHRLLISFVAAACGVLVLVSAVDALAVQPGQNHEWTSIHGNLANQRYVPLDQINPDTISKLGATWVSEPFADGATSRMTPLMHEGRMFLGAGPYIYALDARTGKAVWTHQTETRKLTGAGAFGDAIADAQASGLAYTRSWGLALGDGMIFAGLMNGHVIALREDTGEVVWDKLISEEPLVIAKGVICPPQYVDGVLYFGLGHEWAQGQVVAVDAKSGQVLWRSPTVPKPGQPGHETWPPDSEIWPRGGAHPWAAGAVDPSLGLIYFVTGNPGPPSGGKIRPGDNLYSDSLIALEMKTGKFRWYHQLVHHDIWEADLSVSPVLFDIEIGGQMRKSVAAMRGDGYLFLFDRATGKPLAPIDERPVPQNPDLFTAPTQPYPRDATSILPPCESLRTKIPRGFVLGCAFDPPSHDVPNRLAQFASVRITPMSYDPHTGYFFAQGTNALMWQGTADDPYVWITNINGARVPNYPRHTIVVAAVDSRTNRVVWSKDLPSFDDFGYRSSGGALSTAGGLVFHQGGDGTLQAYDAMTGKTLWRFQTDFATGDASPMSYALDGKQHVAFVAGSKVWAFALGGKLPQAASVPPPPWEEVRGPIEDTNEIETLSLEQAPGHGHRYRLNEYAFNPYRARIRAGSSVKFINNGYLPRTIVARDGSWATGKLAPTQVATVAFDTPGSYIYLSKEHPWSYGQIIVVPSEAGSDTSSGSQNSPAVSEQVNLGKTGYAASCSACHGENLSGRDLATALTGGSFNIRWAGRDALDLFNQIRTTMPPSAPGTLSDDNYAAIVSYIMYSNGNRATVELDRQTMKGLAVTTE